MRTVLFFFLLGLCSVTAAFAQSAGVAVRRDEVSTIIATNAANVTHLWVSALDGDDATGQRGNFNLKFLTVRAAENVSQLGDTIHVMRGQYLETLLGAEGLVYELAADAVVGATNLPGPIFFASNVSFRLKGTGFVFSSTKAVETSGIGQIYMEGVTISPNSTTNNLSGTWFTP
jgi:hypothetical protein